jgi:hypothetical protein
MGAMRNPAFSSAVRSGAPVLTTIQAWLSFKGGAADANMGLIDATHAMRNRSRLAKGRAGAGIGFIGGVSSA